MGAWLVKFETPWTKDMILLQVYTFESKLFSMKESGQRYPQFEFLGPALFFFFLIERSNEIYYPTAQSREQIMREQSANILRYCTVIIDNWLFPTVKKNCLTSWLHLPSLVPYLTTVPCLLVKSLQLLKYRQRLIQSVVAL